MKKRLFKKKNNATAVTGFQDHLIANALFAAAVMLVLLLNQNNCCLEILAGMVLSTLMMSPDMDSSRSVVYRNWWVLKYLWWPYTEIFHHKGRDFNRVFNTKRGMGHNLILGTVFRVLYGSLLLWLIGSCLPGIGIKSWIVNHKVATGYIVLGIWLADVCHILVDGLVHRNG